MKGFIIGVVLLGLCVIGFGFYRGWFVMSSPTPEAGSDKVSVEMTTDKGKVKEDVEAVKEKASELTGNSTDSKPETEAQPIEEAEPNGVTPNNK